MMKLGFIGFFFIFSSLFLSPCFAETAMEAALLPGAGLAEGIKGSNDFYVLAGEQASDLSLSNQKDTVKKAKEMRVLIKKHLAISHLNRKKHKRVASKFVVMKIRFL